MGNTETAVEFRNVTKAYGEVRAVRNFSFSIERGKLVTLLGPSGCGKTTTLRLIAGLEMVTEGNIFIGGKEVTRLSASDRDVSMVFQSYALFPHMTVMQNVSYGLTMSRLSKPKRPTSTSSPPPAAVPGPLPQGGLLTGTTRRLST